MRIEGPIRSQKWKKSLDQVDREPVAGILEPLKENGWHHVVIIILILMAGAYLRFSELPHSSTGTDEAEKYFAVQDFSEGRFWVDLEHPPLEKYLILGSISIFGDEDWAVKLPNVIIGSLIPFALFLVAARVAKNPWAGHTAAMIGALSPILIGYSLVAKEDTLVNFLALLAILFLSVSLQYDRGKEKEQEIRHFRSSLHPKILDGYALTGGIIAGLALASKYTFVFYGASALLAIFFMDRTWFRRKGPAFAVVMIGTFLLLSWYYLNPYWLALGLGHWLWESATGHATYFLGRTYTYPPLWFYPVTFIGRMAPLITIGALIAVVTGFMELFGKRENKRGHIDKRSRLSELSINIRERIGEDPLRWMLFFWIVVVFVLMTLLPFKGIRYVQWLILPMIVLTAYFLSDLVSGIFKKRKGVFTFAISLLLMLPALSHASPYYREVVYFLDEDSGMMDLDGQGFREAFQYMEENGLEGRVSVRWEKLASYYWDNVTGPCTKDQELSDKDVSFMLIYRADTNRNIEPEFTELSREQEEIFVHDRDGYEILWLYRVKDIDGA